jgi:hypothetical protein
LFRFFCQELRKKAAKGTSGRSCVVPSQPPVPLARVATPRAADSLPPVDTSKTEALKEKDPARSSSATTTAGGHDVLSDSGVASAEATTSVSVQEDPKV